MFFRFHTGGSSRGWRAFRKSVGFALQEPFRRKVVLEHCGKQGCEKALHLPVKTALQQRLEANGDAEHTGMRRASCIARMGKSASAVVSTGEISGDK